MMYKCGLAFITLVIVKIVISLLLRRHNHG